MPITMFYAGLLALWFLVLSVKVIGGRREGQINLGDGGQAGMLRLIRGHANFAEYVPLILLLMAFLETSGAHRAVIHAAGAVLLLARLLHGYALSFSPKFFFGRFVGTLATLILLLVLGGLSVYRSLPSL